jgi:hypothetical protein
VDILGSAPLSSDIQIISAIFQGEVITAGFGKICGDLSCIGIHEKETVLASNRIPCYFRRATPRGGSVPFL